MNDPDEGFLQRWSRRKAQVEARAPLEEPPAPAAPETTPASAAEPTPPELPPVETLTADSDFSAFLKAGVPRALRHAALRKAWASNPAIAGHKPLVEYDWDLNAPGYGRLWDGDDAKKLAGAVLRHLEERLAAPEPEPAAAPPPPQDPPAPPEDAAPPTAEEPPEDPHPVA